MTGRVVPYGPSAWLVEHDDPAALAAAVRAARRAGVVEVVPAAATTLVTVRPGTDPGEIGEWLARLATTTGPAVAGTTEPTAVVEIPVVYDGVDLDAVAEAAGLTVEEVITRHRDRTYRCAFCGFAPGFAYLTGLDPELHLPRRATPRPRIPAGAVALAGGYTAVYPSASPGGWHLVGRTDVELWRTDRDPPALVTPGAQVRFVGVRPS